MDDAIKKSLAETQPAPMPGMDDKTKKSLADTRPAPKPGMDDKTKKSLADTRPAPKPGMDDKAKKSLAGSRPPPVPGIKETHKKTWPLSPADEPRPIDHAGASTGALDRRSGTAAKGASSTESGSGKSAGRRRSSRILTQASSVDNLRAKLAETIRILSSDARADACRDLSATGSTATPGQLAARLAETESVDSAASAPVAGGSSSAGGEPAATADLAPGSEKRRDAAGSSVSDVQKGRQLADTVRDEEIDADAGGPAQLPDTCLPFGAAQPVKRYEVGSAIGRTASGVLNAARDHNLGREIAFKSLDPSAARNAAEHSRFVAEAQITASLEHPNVDPVYDLDRTRDGGLFVTMRRIAGTPLGELLLAARGGAPPEAIGSLYQRIAIVLKVCDALTCAHARRVVHRDVKPDNIVVGHFGEVVLSDWSSACVLDGADLTALRATVGTPLYMSPEQARGEAVDERTDVYALGATLFEMLVLRPPTLAEEVDAFWGKKRVGIIDALNRAERGRAPRRLLAIAYKALAARIEERYPSVEAFAADLRAWHGGSGRARRGAFIAGLLHDHRYWCKRLAVSIAIAGVLAAGAAAIYGDRVKAFATWGRPILDESTIGADWMQFWRVGRNYPGQSKPGTFALDHGRLMAQGQRMSEVFFDRRLGGAVAIEFDAVVLPGHDPGDLSVVWVEGDPWETPDPWSHPEKRPSEFRLTTCARDNLCAQIERQPDGGLMSVIPYKLETGRTYRIRAEIVGTRLALSVDGKLLCEHITDVPSSPGYIGLSTCFPGKAFSNIRIWN